MDLDVLFNRCEAGLWLGIAAFMGIAAFRQQSRGRQVPSYHWTAIPAFAVFGVSDIIESYTGAWWTPWWLLVMKAGCILVLVLCLAAHRKAARAKSGKTPERSAPRADHQDS